MVKLETEAKILIQKEILKDNIELVWSYILHYENNSNPYIARKKQIAEWGSIASITVTFNEDILAKAKDIVMYRIKIKDALHISCAIHSKADFFNYD